MKSRIVVVGITALAALLVAACGGGGQQPASQQPPAAQAPTSSQAPAAGRPAANVITASEQEWSITLSRTTAPAGTYTFTIKNNGSIEHDFVIEGMNARTGNFPPGQTRTLTVTLKPGTYTIICDIPGHEEAGMKTQLTVQ